MIQVELSRIIIDEKRQDQVIVLKEKTGERQIPIVIGFMEASSIKIKISGVDVPRPMTHDLLVNVMQLLGGRLERVIIDKLVNNTFHAKLEIKSKEGEVKMVDSRPSDSIALAVRFKAPIFVADEVLAKIFNASSIIMTIQFTKPKKSGLLPVLSFYPPLSHIRDALGTSKRRVYLVGGALRDYYLNRQGTDLDFAVDQGSIALSRQLARRLKATFVLLDREHGSARIVKKIDGVVWTFDLTDWRGASIQKDLGLRDFTINALAIDIFSKDVEASGILEIKGSGRDLKAGVVRMVTRQVFKDDPLRLLRAFTLQATLGFRMDTNTRSQIKKDAHLISTVAAERIHEEIFKILGSSRAFETLSSMDKIGLLPRVIPQITVMNGVIQGGYHHLNVWRHSLEVVAQMEKLIHEFNSNERIRAYLQEIIGGGHTRLSLLKMAALLHDIGKPETRRREGTRTTFHGHEHAGERITRQVAKQLKLSVKERYFLENAVRMHLRPGYLSNFKRPSEKAIFRYLRDSKEEAVSLAILGLADQAATRGPLTTKAKHKHHAKVCYLLIDRYFELKDQKPKQRLLTGYDLIKVLKMKPSELFGKILTSVEEAVALGKIKTKQEAIALARKINTIRDKNAAL